MASSDNSDTVEVFINDTIDDISDILNTNNASTIPRSSSSNSNHPQGEVGNSVLDLPLPVSSLMSAPTTHASHSPSSVFASKATFMVPPVVAVSSTSTSPSTSSLSSRSSSPSVSSSPTRNDKRRLDMKDLTSNKGRSSTNKTTNPTTTMNPPLSSTVPSSPTVTTTSPGTFFSPQNSSSGNGGGTNMHHNSASMYNNNNNNNNGPPKLSNIANYFESDEFDSSVQSLRTIFKMMDTDGNNELQEDEFAAGLQACGIYFSPEEVQKIFTEADKSKSGSLSLAEFIQLFGKFRSDNLKTKMNTLHRKNPAKTDIKVRAIRVENINEENTGSNSFMSSPPNIRTFIVNGLHKLPDFFETELWNKDIETILKDNGQYEAPTTTTATNTNENDENNDNTNLRNKTLFQPSVGTVSEETEEQIARADSLHPAPLSVVPPLMSNKNRMNSVRTNTNFLHRTSSVNTTTGARRSSVTSVRNNNNDNNPNKKIETVEKKPHVRWWIDIEGNFLTSSDRTDHVSLNDVSQILFNWLGVDALVVSRGFEPYPKPQGFRAPTRQVQHRTENLETTDADINEVLSADEASFVNEGEESTRVKSENFFHGSGIASSTLKPTKNASPPSVVTKPRTLSSSSKTLKKNKYSSDSSLVARSFTGIPGSNSKSSSRLRNRKNKAENQSGTFSTEGDESGSEVSDSNANDDEDSFDEPDVEDGDEENIEDVVDPTSALNPIARNRNSMQKVPQTRGILQLHWLTNLPWDEETRQENEKLRREEEHRKRQELRQQHHDHTTDGSMKQKNSTSHDHSLTVTRNFSEWIKRKFLHFTKQTSNLFKTISTIPVKDVTNDYNDLTLPFQVLYTGYKHPSIKHQKGWFIMEQLCRGISYDHRSSHFRSHTLPNDYGAKDAKLRTRASLLKIKPVLANAQIIQVLVGDNILITIHHGVIAPLHKKHHEDTFDLYRTVTAIPTTTCSCCTSIGNVDTDANKDLRMLSNESSTSQHSIKSFISSGVYSADEFEIDRKAFAKDWFQYCIASSPNQTVSDSYVRKGLPFFSNAGAILINNILFGLAGTMLHPLSGSVDLLNFVTGSAKIPALDLASRINAFNENITINYYMKGWIERVREDVSTLATRKHVNHIDTLTSCTEMMSSSYSNLSTSLNEILRVYNDSTGSTDGKIPKTVDDSEMNAVKFIVDILRWQIRTGIFTQYKSDVQHTISTINATKTEISQLRDIYKAIKEEQRENISMILTGVTTLALPISAVTGYFGMNFSDMTELSPGNGRLYGVQMFWYALLGLLVLGFLLAWRFRVLAVIQASFR